MKPVRGNQKKAQKDQKQWKPNVGEQDPQDVKNASHGVPIGRGCKLCKSGFL